MNKFYIFSFIFLLLIFFCFFKKYLDIKEPYETCDPNAPKNYNKCGGSGGESEQIQISQEELNKLDADLKLIEEGATPVLEMYDENQEIIKNLKDKDEESNEGKEKAFDYDEHDKSTKRKGDFEVNA